MESKDESYEVYWIHLPEHTDITKEGYVGITKTGVQRRFYVHHRDAVKDPIYVIHRALNKHWDNIIVDVICVCDGDYASYLENSLRPEFNIGWNITSGGVDAISKTASEAWKDPNSKFNSPEYRKQLSENSKRNWSDPKSRKKMEAAIRKGWEDPNSLLGTEEWARRISEGRKRAFKEDPSLAEAQGNRDYYKDPEYLKRQSEAQRKAYSDNPELAKKQSERMKAKMPWENNKANKDLWLRADHFYEVFQTSTKSSRQQALDNNMKPWALNKIHKHFKSGWNPAEDEKWLEWRKENG